MNDFLDRHPFIEKLLDIALATAIGTTLAYLLFIHLSS